MDRREPELTEAPAASSEVDAGPLSGRDRLVLLAFVVVGVGLYVWRVWDRFIYPGIFAEDGLIFYLQAEEIGVGAIFKPYAGYLHLIPRLGAAAFSPFGLSAVPLGYALLTTVLTLAGFAVVLSRRLDRLLPSVWSRGLAFLMLCLTPQWAESATLLAYLIFIGGIPLLLLGLSRSPRSIGGRVVEGVVVALLGLSGPLVVFFSPAYAYRWLRDRTLANGLLVGVVAVTAGIQILVFSGANRATQNNGLALAGRGYLQRVVGEWLASPSSAEAAFQDKTFFRWIAAAWLAAVLLVLVVQRVWDGLVALAVSGFAFAWAVRTYGEGLFFVQNGNRHMLVPGSILIVATVAALGWSVLRAREASTGGRRLLDFGSVAVSGVVLLATIGGIPGSFRIPPHIHLPTHAELVAFQECMDQGRRDCTPVEIAPEFFVIDPNHPWDPEPY